MKLLLKIGEAGWKGASVNASGPGFYVFSSKKTVNLISV